MLRNFLKMLSLERVLLINIGGLLGKLSLGV